MTTLGSFGMVMLLARQGHEAEQLQTSPACRSAALGMRW